MIPKKVKVFFKNKNISGHDFQTVKWIAIGAIIISIILAAVIFRMSGRDRIVVAIDQLGQPHQAQVQDEEIHNVVNYKQFIRSFLGHMWSWDEKTFPHQINSLKKLMTEECWNDLALEIKKENYIERIRDYELTSSIVPPKEIPEAKIYYNDQGKRIGWYVSFKAAKITFSDVIKREEAQKYDITFNTNKLVKVYRYEIVFKNTELTPENIWGLKVFKFKQNLVKKKGELLE
jgi:hypothetical protein